MEFGSLPLDASTANVTLPEDRHAERTFKPTRPFAFRFGLPIWASDDFVGPLYPEETKKADYLRAYGGRCSAIELNATFYSVPPIERTRGWAECTPPEFRFCPKMPKGISHARELKKEVLASFMASLDGFGERLGPVFIQLPEWADTNWRRPLFDLLEALPPNRAFAVELRHESWFEETTWGRLATYLEKKGIGAVITDAPSRRDVVHMTLTAPFTLVRFLGHDAASEDFRRIDEWLTRIERWKERGLEEAYFFVHHAREVEGIPLLEPLRLKAAT